jgi:5-(carboxyamino)imidazole ribonucleotide mutase
MYKVAIVMGSVSDWDVLRPAVSVLKELSVPVIIRALSAHRTPDELIEFVNNSDVHIFIAAAGGAAHLAGTIAARTIRPVIGVPISSSSLNGLDSLLSTVQMPPGVVTATVSIDGAVNAALLAAQIIAVSDDDMNSRLLSYRNTMRNKVCERDKALQAEVV